MENKSIDRSDVLEKSLQTTAFCLIKHSSHTDKDRSLHSYGDVIIIPKNKDDKDKRGGTLSPPRSPSRRRHEHQDDSENRQGRLAAHTLNEHNGPNAKQAHPSSLSNRGPHTTLNPTTDCMTTTLLEIIIHDACDNTSFLYSRRNLPLEKRTTPHPHTFSKILI
ncbi:hypothetical protein Tco_1175005 [Tanacetum coccineum]